jgi:beta propeller domain-containing protein
MHSRLLSVLTLTTLMSSLSLLACSDGGGTTNLPTPRPPSGTPGGTVPARLVRAQSCDDLEVLLKADARKKLDDGIDEQIKAIRDYGGFWGYGYGRDGGFNEGGGPVVGSPNSGGAGSGGASPAPLPPKDDSSDGGGEPTSGGDDDDDSGGGGEAPDYSDTNTQVKGVDEADFVETDGENIYLLHGSKFLTMGAQPSGPAVSQQIVVEGSPREMFVTRLGEGGPRRAVIYSDVNGAGVYAAAGVEPRAAYAEYGYAGGGIIVEDFVNVGDDGGDVASPARAAAGAARALDVEAPVEYAPLTKVTVLDLPDGDQPKVVSEVYFEGQYATARRVGPIVRTVLNGGEHGPQVSYYPKFDAGEQVPASQDVEGWVAVFEQVRAEGRAAIDASTYADWLPYYFVKAGGAVTAQNLACDSYHVPGAGTTRYGLTQVQSFDVAAPEQLRGTAVVGRADVVYSNADSLYIAAHGWNPTPPRPVIAVPPSFPGDGGGFPGSGGACSSDGQCTGGSAGVAGSAGAAGTGTGGNEGDDDDDDAGAGGEGGDQAGTGQGGSGEGGSGQGGVTPLPPPPPPPPPTTLNVTHLHKFDLRDDPTRPLYVATGTAKGNIQNQFSLDERDGFLRVATTEDRTTGQDFWSTERYNRLFVLEERDGELVTVGDAGELAKDETVMSVRFVGSKGYVVTFLQKDPLFVFDLADPYAPRLLGQLDIPGFSQYMHPVDDTHLLTIGQDGDENGSNGRLALQIFDVSDPLRPLQAHKFTFAGDQYGYSQAQYDHKAFTYFEKQKLLAFPYSSNTYTPEGYYKPTSALEVFRVDLVEGISRVGAVDHSPLFPPQTPCSVFYYGPEVRRGLFINRDGRDFVYSISYAGLMVNDVANLAAGPVGQIDLLAYLDPPASLYPGREYYDGYCAPGGGGGVDGGPVKPLPEPLPSPTPVEDAPTAPAGAGLARAD